MRSSLRAPPVPTDWNPQLQKFSVRYVQYPVIRINHGFPEYKLDAVRKRKVAREPLAETIYDTLRKHAFNIMVAYMGTQPDCFGHRSYCTFSCQRLEGMSLFR
jgi:hypothetical protein